MTVSEPLISGGPFAPSCATWRPNSEKYLSTPSDNVDCPESSHLTHLRRRIEEQYGPSPTDCGGSFGEILCWEIHEAGETFTSLAQKWGLSLPTLGELIWDHCKRLEPEPVVKRSSTSRA